jgi:serine/threonine-protein kinase HipA
MARRRTHAPLLTFLNDRLVGRLSKQPSGAIDFAYDAEWLAWEHAMPVSLSLPLREARYIGAPVVAVFENLLPDSDPIRRRVAERVGAAGVDAYSLLSAIGRDCVGAMQFVPDDDRADAAADGEAGAVAAGISGTVLDDDDIADMLANLRRAPLGVGADIDEDFRISIAGAQEKTALLRYKDQWLRPHARTPTTHIFKPQIGHIQTAGGTIDLSDSVDNEYYCLKLMEAFGLTANKVEIAQFGERKVLVIERFDRTWTRDGRLIRLPQEDCCQALSVPPTQKYQSEGGPGVADIVDLLRGSDEPQEDQLAFFKSQIVFWLIGATDGHAKNFSLFLRPAGRFRLTLFYDVLTAQPSLDARQIRRNGFKLAMSVGDSGHYRIHEVTGRHFVETARRARLPRSLVQRAVEEILAAATTAFERVQPELPLNFPGAIHDSVQAAVTVRARQLEHAWQ